jgi:hypothetical protein
MLMRTLSAGFGASLMALLLMAPSVCTAQDSPLSSSRHTNRYLRELVEAEKYVAAAEMELKSQGASDAQSREPEQWSVLGALQTLAAARANVGDAAGAIDAFDQKWRRQEKFFGRKLVGNERVDLATIDSSHSEDAVAAIVKAARSRQVVILNEAHHVPFDRVFAMHLARALRKEGFEYLACETFFIDDEHVLERGYVVEKTGVYSREPTFAKFLMDAKADGWKLTSYEPSGADKLRESGMAQNLIKRIFAANPKAKVFVYAGYSHAKKIPVSHSDDDDSRLAAQLLRLTGIDPLTVNQTTLCRQCGSAQQARCYEHASRKLTGRSPATLVDSEGKPIHLELDDLAYDLEVVHPAYIDDPATRRPEWLRRDFKPHDIPRNMLPTKGRRVVYAYARDTAPDAAPLDAVMLHPGMPAPKLMLPPGDFVFEYED